MVDARRNEEEVNKREIEERRGERRESVVDNPKVNYDACTKLVVRRRWRLIVRGVGVAISGARFASWLLAICQRL